MTRREFDNINNFSELIDAVGDYGLSALIDVHEYYDVFRGYDSIIQNDLRDTSWSWQAVRDALTEIDDNGDYFYIRGTFDYVCIDDDFGEYKSAVADEMERWDYFDEEDPDDDVEREVAPRDSVEDFYEKLIEDRKEDENEMAILFDWQEAI